MNSNPATPGRPLRTILATDCGSTTTKAILVMHTAEGYRLAGRGEAPTTVEAPFDDVTVGVHNAVEELEAASGRTLIGEQGLICPGTASEGIDAYVSTSSAGGGLQMAVAGVISGITGQSAERAALGAGAIVIDAICLDDPREDHEHIERLRHMRPDMILMAGGVNGGTRRHVEMLAEIIRSARPQPRFGQGFQLPVVFGGNTEARDLVEEMLGDLASLRHVNNVRPSIEGEDLGQARQAIHDLFLDHVMQQAPGYGKLMAMTHADIMPTPSAVGACIEDVARTREQNVLAVDIGGATTDVFSVFRGQFHRSVSANYGMSYSLCNVMAETGTDHMQRWLPFPFATATLRDILRNKMIRPTTIPETLEELYIEQAAAREALRLSLNHHRDLAVDLRARSHEKDLSSLTRGKAQSLVDLMRLDLCIGSGGVLSHAPERMQAALMMLDGFQLEGFTELAVDSIFMMPQLGVMAQVQPDAAAEVFEKDCLIILGSAVAPTGEARPGRPAMEVTLRRAGQGEQHTVCRAGGLTLLPLPANETAEITVTPRRGLDMGPGRGKPVTREVRGGVLGLLLDARGRPLPFASNQAANASQRRKEYQGLGLPLP